jgi:NAD(P)-dependent dehydrogenase (short-subunit alcohol dehydrogenase family)
MNPESSYVRVVLVAGGTGGLGRAVSLAFLEQGWTVAVTYRNGQELASLQAAAGANSVRLDGHQTDVTDRAAVQALVAGIQSRHGGLDALVNSVGGFAGGKKLWEQDPSVLDRMLDLNVRAGYILAGAVVPAMLAQGRGAIVNVASRAALDHAAGIAEYAASKAAAVAMMDSLAADLKGTGVRVNSILPGVIDTEPNRKAMPGADFSKWARPEEIARVVFFLCSDAASLISGASIPVYGES